MGMLFLVGLPVGYRRARSGLSWMSHVSSISLHLFLFSISCVYCTTSSQLSKRRP